VTGHVIVRFKSPNDGGLSVSSDAVRQAHARLGAKVLNDFTTGGLTGLQLVQLVNGTDVQTAIREYQADPDVLYAEPDYAISITPDETGPVVRSTGTLQIASIPDDPLFSNQWSLDNTGQAVSGITGTLGADINATPAWDISTGSNSVIVAVVDTGVDYNHPDLAANIWTNPVDGTHGWNFVANTPNPLDDNGHGTHVSGTIGAVGDNNLGVAGVNWHVQIMALKFLDASGRGSTSNAISAILYANAHGASVISNSWGGSGYDQSLKDAIDASPAVVVCAAGNNASDNDIIPVYPASYTSADIISVAATDQNDQRASFSDYGPGSVHLAAPGVNIQSTYSDGNYMYMSGTSQATPHVSGVAALVKSINPNLTNVQIKDIILNNVHVLPSLSGKVSTGGRLDAYKAVFAAEASLLPVANFTGNPKTGPVPLTVTFTDLSTNGPTAWNWTFGDGNAVNATVQDPVHTYLTPGNYAVSLTATNKAGSSTTMKTNYISVTVGPPTVTAISPTSGTTSGGTPVTITGTGFTGATGVKFGSTAATAFTVGNATSITATSPAGTAGTVDVTVTTSSGISATSSADQYTYVVVPTASAKVGVFRSSTGTFYLASSNTNGGGTVNAFTFGLPTDTPIRGNWSGHGATVGVFRPSNGVFYLASSNTNGGGTVNAFNYGLPTDTPIAGNWNGQGTTVGVFRSSTGTFYLASSNTNGGGTVNAFTFGLPTDTPIAGNWNGQGTTVGVFRSSTGTFYLASSNTNGGGTVNAFTFGLPGDVPIVGDWSGSGSDTVGVFRPSTGVFYLASSNTNGGGTVNAFNYGLPTDTPIAGNWI
jgi:subtilisin family serine protease